MASFTTSLPGALVRPRWAPKGLRKQWDSPGAMCLPSLTGATDSDCATEAVTANETRPSALARRIGRPSIIQGMTPLHVAQLLEAGARVRVPFSAPHAMNYVNAAIKGGGHVEFVGGGPPPALLNCAKAGKGFVSFDLAG